uniref:Predicted gene, 17364 n=1 Tax=Peromyscus maniculatus bairdii TaxID=230844 RepID=A0A8C8TVS9_PERMB
LWHMPCITEKCFILYLFVLKLVI